MDIFDDLGKEVIKPLAIGAGILLVAPIVFPAVEGSLRPIAKRALRGGMKAASKAREVTAEAREQWSDLVAEVKSEQSASNNGQGTEQSAKRDGQESQEGEVEAAVS